MTLLFLLCKVSFLRLKLHGLCRHQWSPIEVIRVEMLYFMTGHQNSCLTSEKSVTQKWAIPHAHFYHSVAWTPTGCSLNGRPWVFKISPVLFAIWLIAERPWRRLNSNPVCFGAKDNQFGAFVVEVGGHINAVKLIHLHGQVSCNVSRGLWSKWGCGGNSLVVFLTNSTDDILMPKVEGDKYKYKIEGYK